MKKIPSLFLSTPDHKITEEVNPLCQWVLDGEGTPTAKLDGTACMVKDGKLYKRYDNSKLRSRDERVQKTQPQDDWIHCGCTTERGKFIYWIPVTIKDYYHQIGWEWSQGNLKEATYELVGPEVQGNRHRLGHLALLEHGKIKLENINVNPRTFEDIRMFISLTSFEGIVWHHEDGRMAKITKKKFGFPWGSK